MIFPKVSWMGNGLDFQFRRDIRSTESGTDSLWITGFSQLSSHRDWLPQLTILSEFGGAKSGFDRRTFLWAPDKSLTECDGVSVDDLWDFGGEVEVCTGWLDFVGIFALVKAEDVVAVLDGRLVRLHQKDIGEAHQLLVSFVFGRTVLKIGFCEKLTTEFF